MPATSGKLVDRGNNGRKKNWCAPFREHRSRLTEDTASARKSAGISNEAAGPRCTLSKAGLCVTLASRLEEVSEIFSCGADRTASRSLVLGLLHVHCDWHGCRAAQCYSSGAFLEVALEYPSRYRCRRASSLRKFGSRILISDRETPAQTVCRRDATRCRSFSNFSIDVAALAALCGVLS